MLAAPLAAALARRGIHYGWVMVALTFLIAVSSAGALGVLGALMLPLQRETGWDISAISGALALRLLLFGLMAPFAAALLQRYGLRRMVAIALTVVAAGLLLSMRMTRVWELWLYWGAITGIGTGMTAMVRYTGTPSHPIKPKVNPSTAATSGRGNRVAATLRKLA